MGLAEGGGVNCDVVGEANVDAGDAAGVEETLTRYERLLRHGRQMCTHRSILEKMFGTETESGMEDLKDKGVDVTLEREGVGADLAEDELGVAETRLGLTEGFEVELVCGR